MDPIATIAEAAPQTAAPVSRFWEIFPSSSLFGQLFTVDTAIKAARVALALVLGLVFVGLVITVLKKITSKRMEARTGGLVVKVAQYLGFAFILINTLEAAKVNLSALLGAAGIAGIAIGFAAQTSVSNFISGFFIVSEKTFAQGDVIKVGDTSGIVFSIDAMSVKLRTFDNQLIRIPNETLIKSNVANITRFPVRRLNIDILVTYETDIERARGVSWMLRPSARTLSRIPRLFSWSRASRTAASGFSLAYGSPPPSGSTGTMKCTSRSRSDCAPMA